MRVKTSEVFKGAPSCQNIIFPTKIYLVYSHMQMTGLADLPPAKKSVLKQK